MKILVSACLLGDNCKYNGGNNFSELLAELVKKHRTIRICPEQLGGLPTPRTPAEIVNGTVINREGQSVDTEFRKGAEIALQIACENHVDVAILQSRSPSCGVKEIYDGTFSGKKIPGAGVFAGLLQEQGVKTIDVEEIMEAVQRVGCMERAYQKLQNFLESDTYDVETNAVLQQEVENLSRYVSGEEWPKDYELAKMGLLPESLIEGLFADQGLFELLQNVEAVLDFMA